MAALALYELDCWLKAIKGHLICLLKTQPISCVSYYSLKTLKIKLIWAFFAPVNVKFYLFEAEFTAMLPG